MLGLQLWLQINYVEDDKKRIKLLFANIKKSEANTIIKRLDMMIKKNEKSNK